MTLSEQVRAVCEGAATSRALVEAALARIAQDPRPYTEVFAEEARRAADACDERLKRGQPARALEGAPISVKDLFDMAGRATGAGVDLLRQGEPAIGDADVVARLRREGAIIVGRTHMSPFAFSGVGLNPEGPQPVNPRDPERAPGGSSSGGGVTVGLGQLAASLGTDTGGSVRIPAACCGVVGFKPTKARISCAGATPLSPTLDSVGPLAATVEDCRLMDAVLAGDANAPTPHVAGPVTPLRFGVLRRFVGDGLEDQVARDFERALSRLSAAGARIDEIDVPELDRIPELESRGGVINAEAYAVHARAGWLSHPEAYDANVLARIELGGRMSASDYLDVLWGWRDLAARADAVFGGYDAVLWPTCPIRAPRLDSMATPECFAKANALLLRNARIVNLMDRCALSLPMSDSDDLPTSLMLTGARLGDHDLLTTGVAVERAIAPR